MANLISGVNQALYNLLKGNVRTSGKVVPVFTKVAKSGQKFPYVVIGDDVYSNVDDKDSTRREIFKSIHVFSDDASGRQFDELLGVIFTILDRREPSLYNTMGDGEIVVCSENAVRTLVEEDENTVFHGICTYRIVIIDNS